MANPIITFEMENGDIMKAELYPDIAPNTVKNFVELVEKGFYDGLIFHRVIRGFVIQGGDPTGTGCGGSDKNIKGEFAINGVKNEISHVRGVVSLPRADESTSDASSFFICTKSAPALNSQHAAFGFVVYGADLIDDIAAVKINADQSPTSTITITSISFAKLP